jgi:hypothetical protein
MQFDRFKRREFITLLGGAAAAWHPDAAGTWRFLRDIEQQFSFTRPPTGGPISSAGVFDATGKLVRTLWSAQTNDPRVSNPVAAWDGTLDNGSTAPAGNYTVRVLDHNVQYSWDGAVGNTSPLPHNTMTYHNGGSHITYMAITAAGEMYFNTQYDERWPTGAYTTTANPQVINYPFQVGPGASYTTLSNVCTDDTNVYWDYAPLGFGSNGIIATKVSDKTQVAFSTGVSYGAFSSGISISTDPITGMAVSKSANFIFVTYNSSGHLLVLNKTTGALLHTVTAWSKNYQCVTSPTTGDLWVSYSIGGSFIDTVVKLNVDGAGNPTASGVSITGFAQVEGMAISPDGLTLLLIDTATQQVKAFNTSDGSVKTAFGSSGTFGTSGGYANSPTVTNTKFMFKNMSHYGGNPGYIAYAPDGSFWLGDRGNNRSLHFSAGNSPTYIEQIAYYGGFYAVQVPKNEPSATVFGEYLEWAIDYTKPLSPTNGSWTLLNNWGYAFNILDDAFTILRGVGTYSNGRRYATVFKSGARRVYELTATGTRDTGTTIPGGNYLDAGFNQYATYFVGTDASSWRVKIDKNPFTGFDGSNNPTWGATVNVLTSQIVDLANYFPVPQGDGNFTIPVEGLSNNVVPIFQTEGVGPPNFYGHLGALDINTGNVKWVTHYPTPPTAGGSNFGFTLFYPEAPFFNVLSPNAGGSIQYIPGDTTLFTGYRGEDWGANQCNMWSHWHEDGLLINRFGKAAPIFASQSLTFPAGHTDLQSVGVSASYHGIPNAYYQFKGMEELTGNSAWGGLASVNGNYYLYQGDEWYHGGITRWTVSGANTVRTTDHATTFNGTPTPPNDPTDLLQGLTYASADLPDNTAGWHRNPTTNTGRSGLPWWDVYTNGIICDRHKSPDISVEFTAQSATYTLYRTVPRLLSGNWTINSLVTSTFGAGDPTQAVQTTDFALYIDLLDNTGKKILRMASLQSPVGPNTGLATFWVNDVAITPPQNSQDWGTYTGYIRPLNVQMNVGTGLMTVTYGDFTVSGVGVLDAGASPTAIAKVQLTGVGNAATFAGPTVFTFTKLNFIDS